MSLLFYLAHVKHFARYRTLPPELKFGNPKRRPRLKPGRNRREITVFPKKLAFGGAWFAMHVNRLV